MPTSIFESDGDAERAGVYRRSHAAKYYDDAEDRLVARAVAPEFAPSGAAAASVPDFTVKVVNGVAQVVARGPASDDAAAVEAAALRSSSLLVAPLKAQFKGKGRQEGGADAGGPDLEISPAGAEDFPVQHMLPAGEAAGHRKAAAAGKFSLE